MINTDLENASKIMIGSLEAEAIYVGSNLIWNSVPYDAEIEYLENTGTQYIDTDIFINSTDNFEIGFTAEGYGSWGWVHLNDANGTWITTSNNNNYKWWYGNYNNSATGSYLNGFYNIKYNFKEGISINNGSIISFLGSFGYDSITNISLKFFLRYDFRINEVETGIPNSKFKSFYVKINGTLVRDFISVRVGLVGYMYDKISLLLFGNSGTGNFVLGPDKSN